MHEVFCKSIYSAVKDFVFENTILKYNLPLNSLTTSMRILKPPPVTHPHVLMIHPLVAAIMVNEEYMNFNIQ